MHTVCMVALPVIYAAYLGVAEAARDLAVKMAARKKDDPLTALQVGEMENELVAAQLAHAGMVDMVVRETPGPASTSATLCRRTLVARAAIATVERALVVAGGASFYRELGLERLFRDIQGARYHPVPEKQQTRLTGRFLLGLNIDTP
jgi:alkylation response protein AidB-like acyl-CoA dehydrogenase